MTRTYLQHNHVIEPLSVDALIALEVERAQARILVLSVLHRRARNKYKKWAYAQEARDLNAKIAEYSADTSVKINN